MAGPLDPTNLPPGFVLLPGGADRALSRLPHGTSSSALFVGTIAQTILSTGRADGTSDAWTRAETAPP